MKKILAIMVLGLLLSGNAYAGVNEPGITSIAGCEKALNLQHEKYIKNHLKELIKKNKLVFFMLVVMMTYIPGHTIQVKI